MSDNSCGKCQGCGFLAVRVLSDDHRTPLPPAILEASKTQRLRGNFGRAIHPAGFIDVGSMPTCAMHRGELQDACYSIVDALPRHQGEAVYEHARCQALLTIISVDRKCPVWTPYREGVSPKEEWEERRMKELELHRQKWEATQEAERRKWIDLRETANAQREDKENSRMFWLTVIGIVLALLAVGGITRDSILGRVIPDKWFPPTSTPTPASTQAASSPSAASPPASPAPPPQPSPPQSSKPAP